MGEFSAQAIIWSPARSATGPPTPTRPISLSLLTRSWPRRGGATSPHHRQFRRALPLRSTRIAAGGGPLRIKTADDSHPCARDTRQAADYLLWARSFQAFQLLARCCDLNAIAGSGDFQQLVVVLRRNTRLSGRFGGPGCAV